MKRTKLRKGQAAQLGNIAMTLIVVGVAIAMGVYINRDISQTSFPTVTITNESHDLAANNTCYYLGMAYVSSIHSVENNTVSLTSGNWSFEEPQCIKTRFNPTSDNYSGTYNITYSGWNSTEYMTVQNATKGISSLAQWLPIIMVVFAAAIVVSVIVVWLR